MSTNVIKRIVSVDINATETLTYKDMFKAEGYKFDYAYLRVGTDVSIHVYKRDITGGSRELVCRVEIEENDYNLHDESYEDEFLGPLVLQFQRTDGSYIRFTYTFCYDQTNVSKVVIGDEIKIDLTQDISPQELIGTSCIYHAANGDIQRGTADEIIGNAYTITGKYDKYVIPSPSVIKTNDYSVEIGSEEKAKLISSNIKSGVTLLGVEGSAVVPSGTIFINRGGQYDVTNYATADVVMPEFGTEFATGGSFIANTATNYYVAAGVTTIPAESFMDKTALRQVKLPVVCTTIGDRAFMGCTNLTGVDLYSTRVTSLGERCFKNCTNLVSTELADTSITEVPYECFRYCEALTSTGLAGSQVTKVGDGAFCNCPNITSTGLADSQVIEIGTLAFAGTGITSTGLSGSGVLSLPIFAF